MLIWVCALHCEAKPVIDYYRLSKSSRHGGFDLFRNDGMQCVISGIGKENAAAATAWTAGLNRNTGSMCWLNLGIAGGGGKTIGDIYVMNKITDSQTGRSYYPQPLTDSNLATASCISLEKSGSDYHSRDCYDMEASAYFATAIRFSRAELVHCLKVISDNEEQPAVTSKSLISDLINAQWAEIDNYARHLMELSV